MVGLQATNAYNAFIQPTLQSVLTVVDSISKPKQVRIIGKTDADWVAVELLQSLFEESADKKS